MRVDLTLGRDAHRHLALLCGQIPPADAVHQPVVDGFPVDTQRLEKHPVGVERLHRLGIPNDLHLLGRQAAGDGDIGMVTPARGGERAVEGHTVARGLPGAGSEHLGRTVRPHRVAAAGTIAYLVYLLDRFHYTYIICCNSDLQKYIFFPYCRKKPQTSYKPVINTLPSPYQLLPRWVMVGRFYVPG